MRKLTLCLLILALLLSAGCIQQPVDTPTPEPGSRPPAETTTTASSIPARPETMPAPQITFYYGRLLNYYTNSSYTDGGQEIRGFDSWSFGLDKSEVMQESEVILLSPFVLPEVNSFKPTSTGKEGSAFRYAWKYASNEKPEPILVPDISYAWTEFSTGLDVGAEVTPADSYKATEMVTIKVTARRSLSQIRLSLATDKDAAILWDTAVPPANQWNVSPPELNREYVFSVQLQLKDSSRIGSYKPRVTIGASTVSTLVETNAGQSLTAEAPGLGSLTFQTKEPSVLGLSRSDQTAILLWQAPELELPPPINAWGLSKDSKDKINPSESSLFFASTDNQVTFWVNFEAQTFNKTPAAEVQWVDPSGKTRRTSKVDFTDNTLADTLPLKALNVADYGTWHIKLFVNGELLLNPFFRVMPPEDKENRTISVKEDSPHFVIEGKPFRFVGAFVPDWRQASIDSLMATAKMSGISVLTLVLPYSKNPGDEASLRMLDLFLDRASSHGIYVIVTFIHGFGIAQDKASSFYSPGGIEGLIHNEKLRAAYKDLLKRVITRKNTVNGKNYRDDPTIMAWDLITEPIPGRVNIPGPVNITIEEFSLWVQEMARYTKSLDPNHLVTMCLTGGIEELKDWPNAFRIPEFDFLFFDLNLYEVLYVQKSPGLERPLLSDDFLARYLNYPIFSLEKPVVSQFAYTSSRLNEKFATDYKLQGQIFQEALEKGFRSGMAGATIFSWGKGYNLKPLIKASDWRNLGDIFLHYNATTEPIVIPLISTTSELGTLFWPKSPLQFVRISP